MMTVTHRKSAALVATACACWVPAAWAGLTLTAAEAPLDTPWKEPATFALTREKGSNTITSDLVLSYRSEVQRATSPKFASEGSFGIGVYLHRDNSDGAPRNDRGLKFSYAGLLVPDFGNSGAVASVGYSLKLSTGRGLVEVPQADGSKSFVDKTKNRVVAAIGGYLQPGKPVGSAPVAGTLPSILYFDGGPAAYFDESRGNGLAGTGKVTGALMKLGINYAPLGLAPQALAGLEMVPTFRIAAQTQKDLSASGKRVKATRNLYSVESNLIFGRPDSEADKLTPSLSLSRSVGADVLTGRAQSAKTELTFGLTF